MSRINYWSILSKYSYYDPKVDDRIDLAAYAKNILVKYGDITPLDAERYCNRNIRNIKNKFLQIIDIDKARGVTPPLLFDSTSRCIWQCDNSQYKRVWRFRRSLIKLTSLSDDFFESLCCYAIHCMGGQVYKTRSGNDGGVDGFGVLDSIQNNHIFGHSNHLRIVGQFKNYNSKLQINQFESFLHTLNNVRHMSTRVRKEMPDFFLSAKGPIVGWFVSKNGFQRQVYDQAKWHGVILSDLLDLIEILCSIKINEFGNQTTKLLLKINSSIKFIAEQGAPPDRYSAALHSGR